MTIKTLSMIHQSCVYEHTSFFHLLSLFSSFDGKAEPGEKLQFVFLQRETERKRSSIAPIWGLLSHFLSSVLFFFFPLQQGLKSRCWKTAATVVQIWYKRYKYPRQRFQSSGFYVSRSRNTTVGEELHHLWHTNDIRGSIKASSPLLFRLASTNANRCICPLGWTPARNTQMMRRHGWSFWPVLQFWCGLWILAGAWIKCRWMEVFLSFIICIFKKKNWREKPRFWISLPPFSATRNCWDLSNLKSEDALQRVCSLMNLFWNRKNKKAVYLAASVRSVQRANSPAAQPRTETLDGGREQLLWKAAVNRLQPLFFPSWMKFPMLQCSGLSGSRR